LLAAAALFTNRHIFRGSATAIGTLELCGIFSSSLWGAAISLATANLISPWVGILLAATLPGRKPPPCRLVSPRFGAVSLVRAEEACGLRCGGRAIWSDNALLMASW
jgi:hypothetical protein